MRVRRSRRRWSALTIAFVVAPLVVVVTMALAAFTASVNFSASPGRKVDATRAIAVANLLPANCGGINTIHRIVDNNGNNMKWDTGQQNDTDQIWLGNNTNQRIGGGGTNGADCLVPGGNPGPGNKAVNGGSGADYCYSGPGPFGYTFSSCSNGTRPGPPYTSVSNS
jgi:hypothetical protein